uniref:Uncharacterized protein n=1 Tax=Octopus bimaculoides TaxID=37653 RepID=A0A0L8GS66_OCTBM
MLNFCTIYEIDVNVYIYVYIYDCYFLSKHIGCDFLLHMKEKKKLSLKKVMIFVVFLQKFFISWDLIELLEFHTFCIKIILTV